MGHNLVLKSTCDILENKGEGHATLPFLKFDMRHRDPPPPPPSTNTLTMPKRMWEPAKLSTQCILDRHITTQDICLLSSLCVDKINVCAVTMIWTYYVSWLHSLYSLRMYLSKDVSLYSYLSKYHLFNCTLYQSKRSVGYHCGYL